MSAIPYNSFKQDFSFVKNIGKGNCAVVNQVYHKIDKKSYAHKQISAQSSEDVSQAINEIEVVIGLDEEKVTRVS
jgi:serine/threonine protein kinase